MVITVDGGTFLGKSSISRIIAKRLGFLHISSGVIYKTIVYNMLNDGANLDSLSTILEYAIDVKNHIFLDNDHVEYNGRDITSLIECNIVYENCPRISHYTEIIDIVTSIIYQCAHEDNLIIDGRETGTRLFPNADFKFFLFSKSDRFANKGKNVSNIDVLKKKNQEDEKNGIVKCPLDADRINIDNYQSKEEVATYILEKILNSVIGSISSDKFDAIIPAKSGSKGCKNKNIKLLNGKPLMAYSIETAKELDIITDIILSTDSLEYAKIGEAYGARIPFLRPARLSKSESTDLDFFKHAIFMLYSESKTLPEYFIHLRPTAPLRSVQLINIAIELIRNDKCATSLRSAHKCDKNPYKMFRIVDGYYAALMDNMTPDDANKPRQFFPDVFIPNGYIDIVKTKYILKYDRLHGDKVIPFETPVVVDIDTDEDFNKLAKTE